MSYVDDTADGIADALKHHAVTILNDRVTELLTQNADLERINEQWRNDLTKAGARVKELQDKLRFADTIIASWFTEQFQDSDFEPITVDLDDANGLMSALGFAKITPIRTWAVEVEYSGTGTVYVKAASEAEAMDMVNSESVVVEYCGDCEDADFSAYDSSISALSAEISE